jgi:SIR2-like domain
VVEAVPEPTGADRLVSRLVELARRRDAVTLFLGSGATESVIPTIPGILALADDYAENRPDGGALRKALAEARTASGGDEIKTYLAYRRVFAAWVSGNEFDVVAQEAVLRACRSTIPTRGRWQRVEAPLGERLEEDVDAWALPDGIAALGALLVEQPTFLASRVLTTNFDPLVEIAIRWAGGASTIVPLGPDGTDRPIDADAPTHIYHLHGYWRPDQESNRQRLLHDPDDLMERRPALAERVAALIGTSTVCVIGHSGWDGVLEAAVRRVADAGRRMTVLWGAHGMSASAADELAGELNARLSEGLAPGLRPVVEVFAGIDSNGVLLDLAGRLGVTVRLRNPAVRRVRHDDWERELISEPGTQPPAEVLDLLRQLDRRYQWERSWPGPVVAPTLVFWPLRMRASPSVIHMAQALAAAAVSTRGADVIACLDDFNVDDWEASTDRYKRDILRWFAYVPDSRAPEIVSLQEFIERNEIFGDPRGPEAMRRPTRPWGVAKEAFGERNPSVLSVLKAAKIIPDLPVDDRDRAEIILRALESQNARRLLTPLTLWSYLNHLLLDSRGTASVMTLGGREESPLWDLWRLVFDHGVSQLYNPQIENLTNESQMLRWSSPEALRTYLAQALRRDGWDMSGQYFRWLVQNAFLLPMYLADEQPPAFRGFRLDSWAAVAESVRADLAVDPEAEPAVVELIAKQVSDIYLGNAQPPVR